MVSLKTKTGRSKMPEEQTIPIDQVLQQQFAKVGQLTWEMDMMRQQLIVLENENKELKEKFKGKKK